MSSNEACSLEIVEITETSQPTSVERSSKDHESRPYYFHELETLENMITSFKIRALLLEEEQDLMLTSLMDLREENACKSPLDEGEQSRTRATIDRLISMLFEVDLKVHTKRKDQEEDALHKVNCLINHLVSRVKDGEPNMRHVCFEFIKSCYRIGHCTEVTAGDDVNDTDLDTSFQLMIGKCAADDKLRVRKRLYGLLNYIESQKNE